MPTQLDGMLTAYSSKNSESEDKIEPLEAMVSDRVEQHKAETEQRDDQLDVLRKELEALTNREDEANEGRDSLESDLQALSDAYSNVEHEYRLVASNTSCVQTLDPRDIRNTSTETEIMTLRAKNEHLTEDAKRLTNGLQ